MPRDPVDAIFALHGIGGAWKVLAATGVANRIYATRDVVLRVATDHPDAVADARTESVAAPAAFEAGVMTPRLIVFDDSRKLIDRPYSIWERIHADTLGLVELEMNQLEEVWREVGREIGRLHAEVRVCRDPHGYLDTPGREFNLDSVLKVLVDAAHTSDVTAREIALLIRDLSPYISRTNSDCFVHNDLQGMNIMCSRTGHLRAIIDWGDAGWGDPALDFAAVPLDQMSSALAGYGPENRKGLGDAPEARFVWDRLHNAMDDAIENAEKLVPIAAYRRFLEQS
jgi:aminoglycoside phosphotransferase (APT) family kinase protein